MQYIELQKQLMDAFEKQQYLNKKCLQYSEKLLVQIEQDILEDIKTYSDEQFIEFEKEFDKASSDMEKIKAFSLKNVSEDFRNKRLKSLEENRKDIQELSTISNDFIRLMILKRDLFNCEYIQCPNDHIH